MAEARNRELGLLRRILTFELPPGQFGPLTSYDDQEGSAADLHLPAPAPDSPRFATRCRLEFPGLQQPLPEGSTLRPLPTYRHRAHFLRRCHPASAADAVHRAGRDLCSGGGGAGDGDHAVLRVPAAAPDARRRYGDTGRRPRTRDDSGRPDSTGRDRPDHAGAGNAAIAALRSHEDSLAAALQRLEEQDRLASLGLLSASVAHELNTPLKRPARHHREAPRNRHRADAGGPVPT